MGGLTADREYTIRLHGDAHCRYGDSDERAIASLVTAENVTLSIGAQYLNEDEKLNQAVPAIADGSDIGRQMPMQCDISKMRGYLVSALPDWSGYRFRLLDETVPEIRFRIARAYHTLEYAEPADYAEVTRWTIM